VAELVTAVAEPDYDYLEQCREQLQGCAQQLQGLVGVGGGSTLDLTKALSVLLTNPGPAISYRGFNLIQQDGIPVIALPTTAGTGAEVTPNAVFTDRREQRRLGINTPRYVPTLALLDPLLTVTCPRSVTVASGIDALMQSIESFTSIHATSVSRMFSRQAFALVFQALPRVVHELEDVILRGQLQLGAYYSGIALMNASSGPAGALSYPLGVHFHVPHGLAHAVAEPTIVQWNVEPY
jgi:alcohol dehydrogenase class IV